ncbi:hypothetical protein [Saccharopolyspora elongata]|uniref:Uncharacterized protein n=1 Tax=Saccharopolyspora elongata TaxID=2530387 RepID=A0A4R4XUC3_9PSEU|nr:hypothetical protein [Saccharopolyspora elongata]TDD35201.1 hypothetical protein E1288_43475 [Saccharopolyspora elongata]
MRTVLRGSLGIALALPLVSGLAPAAFAASPAPAVAVQLAPQHRDHHNCTEGDAACEMHEHLHDLQRHLQEHGQH